MLNKLTLYRMAEQDNNNVLVWFEASSRDSKNWKRRQGTWKDFAITMRDKSSIIPHDYSTYQRFSKPRRDTLKDKGGYLGAELLSARRLAANITDRYIITLDLDTSHPEDGPELVTDEFVNTVKYMFPGAFMIHSTASHCEESPRLRLLLPLEEPLDAIKYEAVSRAIAYKICMAWFDKTTFQMSRLMYWPTTTQDTEQVYVAQGGRYFDAETMLNDFYGADNYTDVSLWPKHPLEEKALRLSGQTKQKPSESSDPMVKTFCEVYSISRAINKFLPTLYKPCAGAGDAGETRYSYVLGTTTNGVTVHDDTFFYSFHSSDPAAGECLNSFDLVRMHKFVHNEGMQESSSMKAMREFVANDKECRKLLGRERAKQAENDFSNIQAIEQNEEPETDVNTKVLELSMDGTLSGAESDAIIFGLMTLEDVLASKDVKIEAPMKAQKAKTQEELIDAVYEKLEVDKKGKPISDEFNIKIVWENDPRLKGMLAVNVVNGLKLVHIDAPWSNGYEIGFEQGSKTWRRCTDGEKYLIHNWFIDNYQIKGLRNIWDFASAMFEKRRVNLIAERLDALPEWDGVQRVETLYSDYLGTEDNETTRAMAKIMMCGAIERGYNPGAKFDYTLVMSSREGTGKSSFVNSLSLGFNCDTIQDFKGKDAYEAVRGKWAVELAEGQAYSRSGRDAVKAFLTKTNDDFRQAYGMQEAKYPRTCVFYMTVNEDAPLSGYDDNRRFLTIRIDPERQAELFTDKSKGISVTARMINTLNENIEQIYAEAKYLRIEKKEPIYLDNETEKLMAIAREDFTQHDERDDILNSYLDGTGIDPFFDLGDEGEETQKDSTCVMELAAYLYGTEKAKTTKDGKYYIKNFLNKHPEWVPAPLHRKRFEGLGMQRTYVRKGSALYGQLVERGTIKP